MTIVMMPTASPHTSLLSSPHGAGGGLSGSPCHGRSRSSSPSLDLPSSFAPPNTSRRGSGSLSPHEALIAPSSSGDSHKMELSMYHSDRHTHRHLERHHSGNATSTAVSPSPKTSAVRSSVPLQKLPPGNKLPPSADCLLLAPSDSNDLPSLCSVPSIGSAITSTSSAGGTPTSTGSAGAPAPHPPSSSRGGGNTLDTVRPKKRKAFGITCDTSDETLLASPRGGLLDCPSSGGAPMHMRARVSSPDHGRLRGNDKYSPDVSGVCGFGSFGMNSPWNKSTGGGTCGSGGAGAGLNAFRETCAGDEEFSPDHGGNNKRGETPIFVTDIGGNQDGGNSSFDAVTAFSWLHSPTDAFINGPDGSSPPFFYDDDKKDHDDTQYDDSPKSLSSLGNNQHHSSRRGGESPGNNPASSSRAQFPISPMGGACSMKSSSSPLRQASEHKISYSSSNDTGTDEVEHAFDMQLAERDLMEDDDMSVLMKLATGGGGVSGGERDRGGHHGGQHSDRGMLSNYRNSPTRVGSSSVCSIGVNSNGDNASRSSSRMDNHFLRVGGDGRKQIGGGGGHGGDMMMPRHNNPGGVQTSIRGRNGGIGVDFNFGGPRAGRGSKHGGSSPRTIKQRSGKPHITINTKGGFGTKDSPISVSGKSKKSGVLAPTPISINKLGSAKPKSFHEPNISNSNKNKSTNNNSRPSSQMSRPIEPMQNQSRPVHPPPPPPQIHPQHPQHPPQHPGHPLHHPHPHHHHESMHPGAHPGAPMNGYHGPPRHDPSRMNAPDFSMMNKGYMPQGPQMQQYSAPMQAYHMSPSDPRYHQQYYPGMHNNMPKGMIPMPHMQMGPGKHHQPLSHHKPMMVRPNDGKSPTKKKSGNIRPPGSGNGQNSNSMNHGNAALSAAILRGVTMRPSGKWQAQLYYAGKSRYIGVFDTREKAAMAYEIAREKLKSDPNNSESSKTTASNVSSTEAAVSLARKAAFEGVNEPDPRPIKR